MAKTNVIVRDQPSLFQSQEGLEYAAIDHAHEDLYAPIDHQHQEFIIEVPPYAVVLDWEFNRVTTNTLYVDDIYPRTSGGNITFHTNIVVPDQGWIGQPAGQGVRIELDDTNNAIILYSNTNAVTTVNNAGWDPAFDDTFTLGDATHAWSNMYSVNVFADHIGERTAAHDIHVDNDMVIDQKNLEFLVSGDSFPVVQFTNFSHDGAGWSLDAYYNGSDWRSSDVGSNFQLYKATDNLYIRYNSGTAAGSIFTWTTSSYWDTSGKYYVQKDSNTGYMQVGQLDVGYVAGISGFPGLAYKGSSAAGEYGIIFDSSRSTYINAATGQTIYFRINNATKGSLTATDFTLASSVNLVLADGAWIGGGAAEPRIIFDTTNDYLEMLGGNVGIGESAPDMKLEVKGDGIHLTDPSGGGAPYIKFHRGAEAYDMRFGIGNSTRSSLDVMNTAGTELVTFTFDGKVGVGVTAPTEQFEVKPDTDIVGVIGRAKIGYDGSSSNVAVFAHYDNMNNTDYALHQSADGSTTVNTKTSKKINLGINGSPSMGVYATYLRLFKRLQIGEGSKHDGFIVREAAEVQTTDATQTTIESITLTDANTYQVEARVVGVKSDGTDRASYFIACTVYRTGGGGATIQGQTTLHEGESNAAWDATFTVSGNNLRVSVTGVAATTIEWSCTMTYMNGSN
jgi:hypothetical protein